LNELYELKAGYLLYVRVDITWINGE
jgi:hypothetical protein